MRKVGIWIDKRQAKVVWLEDAPTARLETIPSGVEEVNVTGGSGTRHKGGPQDVVKESKFLEREKHQFRRFFQTVAEAVVGADKLVIFGPGETGQKLARELEVKYTKLAAKLEATHSADSMTDNQTIAWVRDFFES